MRTDMLTASDSENKDFGSVVADSSDVVWMNWMMSVMWPHIREAMKKKADKIFREKMSDELSRHPEISMTQLVLYFDPGMKPPVLERMRVYQRTQQERTGIQLDNDFSWDPDEDFHVLCDMAGSAKAFPISVEKAGVASLSMRGTLSCLASPMLDAIPCVGTGQAFFLDTPSIDMKVTGFKKLVGPLQGLILNLMESVITNVLEESYILPHRYVHKVQKDLPLETLVAMKSPLPLGVLKVEILKAKKLPAADTSLTGKATSDPYVEVKVGFDKLRTSTVAGTVDPVWNDPPAYLFVYNVAQIVRITVHDDDVMGKDVLGNVRGFNVYRMCKKMENQSDGVWLDVTDLDDQPAGQLCMRVCYYDVADLGRIDVSDQLVAKSSAKSLIPQKGPKVEKVQSDRNLRPYVLTVKVLGLECMKPDRGDLRNARATVELVHPPEFEGELDSKAKHEEKEKHHASRLMRGLEAAHSWATEKIKNVTGLGFGHREEGIPMKRRTGKAMSWASQRHISDGHSGEIPALAIRAMERLHVKEQWKVAEISNMFNTSEELVKKAVAMRGNFEVVWHEALHFLQPASNPFLGKITVSVDAPKNMVRGADSKGFVGSFEVDLSYDFTQDAQVQDPWCRRIRTPLSRAKPKSAFRENFTETLRSHAAKKFTKKTPGDVTPPYGAAADRAKEALEEESGILLECIIEVRKLDDSTCEPDNGQAVPGEDDIKQASKTGGVRLHKEDL
jgi:hypothetical protein